MKVKVTQGHSITERGIRHHQGAVIEVESLESHGAAVEPTEDALTYTNPEITPENTQSEPPETAEGE